jgi:hypothetical protein
LAISALESKSRFFATEEGKFLKEWVRPVCNGSRDFGWVLAWLIRLDGLSILGQRGVGVLGDMVICAKIDPAGLGGMVGWDY